RGIAERFEELRRSLRLLFAERWCRKGRATRDRFDCRHLPSSSYRHSSMYRRTSTCQDRLRLAVGAGAFELDCVVRHLEAGPRADAPFAEAEVAILEVDAPPAVAADDVVVMRAVSPLEPASSLTPVDSS